MQRVNDFERVIGDPDERLEGPPHPLDDLFIELILAVTAADGTLQPEERDLLLRCIPGETPESLDQRVASRDIAIDDLADRFTSLEDAAAALRLAALVAWTDRFLDSREKSGLVHFAAAAGLPRDVVEETLADIIGQPRPGVTEEDVRQALEMEWLDLSFEARDPTAFEHGPAIGTVLLDDTELAGLYVGGIAFLCSEGAVWLGWDEIESYTRVPVFGVGLNVTSRDGDCFRVRDPRARGLSTFLDRVFA